MTWPLIPNYDLGSSEVLVALGILAEVERGWLFVDFKDTQTSAEELQSIKKVRADAARRKREQRARETLSRDSHATVTCDVSHDDTGQDRQGQDRQGSQTRTAIPSSARASVNPSPKKNELDLGLENLGADKTQNSAELPPYEPTQREIELMRRNEVDGYER